MIFCEIDDKLVSIIKNRARGRIIIDCGAGDGLLGTKIKGVLGLDICADRSDQLSTVIQTDCTTFPMPSMSLPVFIRPCHSDWVHETIMFNLENTPEFLYISKPSNLDTDLDTESEDYSITLLDGWVGSEEERLYIITSNVLKNKKTETWFLVKMLDWEYPMWKKKTYQWDQWCWENSVGGKTFLSDKDVILDVQDVVDFEDLDHSKTYLGNFPLNYKQGWLSREGKFYQADYEHHDAVAHCIIKKEVPELEKTGWLRIQEQYGHEKRAMYTCEKRTSAAQRKWLLKHDFMLHPSDEE